MKKLTHTVLILMFCGLSFSAAAIYRCDTPQGVVFSQKKCGDNATLVGTKQLRRTPAPAETASRGEPGGKFAGLDSASVEELLDTVGQPSAKYIYKGVEHWFYTEIQRDVNGERRSPEVLLRNGYSFQVSWLENEALQERASIAQKISAWSPSNTQRRQISVEDFDVKGLSRGEVVEKLGEPVAKTISNGLERWEYLGVPAGVSTETYVTVFVDFEGDLVAGL